MHLRVALADGLEELAGQGLGGDLAAGQELQQFGGGAFDRVMAMVGIECIGARSDADRQSSTAGTP